MIELPTQLSDGHGGYAKSLIDIAHIIAIEPTIADRQGSVRYANASRIHLSTGTIIECSWPATLVHEKVEETRATIHRAMTRKRSSIK